MLVTETNYTISYNYTMVGLMKNVSKIARGNSHFRQVLNTTSHTQVVLMSLEANTEIGSEVHPDNDQVIYCVDGVGKVYLNGGADDFVADDLVVIKAGLKHNIVNTGSTPMKIITMYSPPHHLPGTLQHTK